jgi:hypothetical protein
MSSLIKFVTFNKMTERQHCYSMGFLIKFVIFNKIRVNISGF